jgi:cytochrome c551/c552
MACNSAVECHAVNVKVVGSNPTMPDFMDTGNVQDDRLQSYIHEIKAGSVSASL